MPPLTAFAALLVAAQAAAPPRALDARALYDVLGYRLDLELRPAGQELSGWVRVEAQVLAPAGLGAVELDMHVQLTADEVRLESAGLDDGAAPHGARLEFAHTGPRLVCTLPEPLAAGARFVLAVRYHGKPGALNKFDGFHWNTTADGRPWIGTSSQGTGAQYWWPCKDSFAHPEDKPARLRVNLTVPEGLYAVSNGRLVERTTPKPGWSTFRWRHDYPLETYAVSLNVAPYVVVERTLELPGLERPLDFVYCVLPQDADKAALQFAEVPRLLEVYGAAFGPFPFPDSKFALVQTSFWGMEHSTAVAYGNSFPAWRRAHDVKDPFACRNARFDYILVHEVAHEWWGNAVSAADWGDFWLHEGFATYAEGVFVERTQGPDAADEYWRDTLRQVDRRGSLYRGAGRDSEQAYAGILYSKGAWVLHTLRTFVDDDPAWWKTLREFNLAFRYANATTTDFRATLERETGREWRQFFDEWYYGKGYPLVDGRVTVDDGALTIAARSSGSDETGFHVPLDLVWRAGGEQRKARVLLEPGENQLSVPTEGRAQELQITNLGRLLGRFDLRVIAR